MVTKEQVKNILKKYGLSGRYSGKRKIMYVHGATTANEQRGVGILLGFKTGFEVKSNRDKPSTGM